jgi:hypothetical protein
MVSEDDARRDCGAAERGVSTLDERINKNKERRVKGPATKRRRRQYMA